MKAKQPILLMGTPAMRRQESKMILGFSSEDLESFFLSEIEKTRESILEGQELLWSGWPLVICGESGYKLGV